MPVYSEYYYPEQVLGGFTREQRTQFRDEMLPYLRRMRSVEYDGLRLVWSSNGTHQLFDVARDPQERNDLFGDPAYAKRSAALQMQLDGYVKAGGGDPPMPVDTPGSSDEPGAFGDLDEETEERLRELGYVR